MTVETLLKKFQEQEGSSMSKMNQTKTKAVGVAKLDNGRYLATWKDQFGKKHRKQCPTYQQGVRVRNQARS